MLIILSYGPFLISSHNS